MKNLTKVSWGAASALSVVLLGSGVARADWVKVNTTPFDSGNNKLSASAGEVVSEVTLASSANGGNRTTGLIESTTLGRQYFELYSNYVPPASIYVNHTLEIGATLDTQISADGYSEADAIFTVFVERPGNGYTYDEIVASYTHSKVWNYHTYTVDTRSDTIPATAPPYPTLFPVSRSQIGPNSYYSQIDAKFALVKLRNDAYTYSNYHVNGNGQTVNDATAKATAGPSHALTSSIDIAPPPPPPPPDEGG